MKLLGRLGWRGQCSCCNGPQDRKAIRAEETRDWRREFDRWQPASPGDTPGELVPGEADDPLPVDSRTRDWVSANS